VTGNNESDRRAANARIVSDVIDTISSGGFDRLANLVTEDLVFELPYGGDFAPEPIVGRGIWNQMQLMTFKMFSGFNLELTEVYECVDPDQLIAEYRSRAKVIRNGNDYKNRYIGVFRFRDGRISEWKEFHNPEATKVL
jgi:ketosteroid isomerase-like protein